MAAPLAAVTSADSADIPAAEAAVQANFTTATSLAKAATMAASPAAVTAVIRAPSVIYSNTFLPFII